MNILPKVLISILWDSAKNLDYNYERFGPGSVNEMAEFKKENDLIIKDRRIELGLEEPEDTLLDDNVQEVEAHAEVEANPILEVQPTAQGAPSDGASVTPFKLLMPLKLFLLHFRTLLEFSL